MYQNTVQNKKSVRIGSGKVEVGETVASLVNLGAMNGVGFEETWEEYSLIGGNVGEIDTGTKNHQASISGDLIEVDLTKLNVIRGGIDTMSTVAGTAVSNDPQVVAAGAWAMKQFIPLTGKNADGTAPTIASVTAATSGSLTVNTDYTLGQNEHGEWGILITNATKVTTTNQNITIVSSYTPAAAVVMKSGGKRTISARVVRVTNTNEAGKIFRVTIYKAKNAEAITLNLPNDDDDGSAVVPIKLTGKCDTTREVGDQLFEIYDQQGIL